MFLLSFRVIAKSPAADHRTTALLAGSVTALDMLGVWEHCRPHAALLTVMRIIDDTGRLLRATSPCYDEEKYIAGGSRWTPTTASMFPK